MGTSFVLICELNDRVYQRFVSNGSIRSHNSALAVPSAFGISGEIKLNLCPKTFVTIISDLFSVYTSFGLQPEGLQPIMVNSNTDITNIFLIKLVALPGTAPRLGTYLVRFGL